MPATRKHHWTADDVRALMDEQRQWPRYELLDGELLVTPAPGKPQFAVSALLTLLGRYCEDTGVGVALSSPADISLAPDTIMQPDVFVVPEGLISSCDSGDWSDFTWLLLAVEVLSPSSAAQDRVSKRDFYLVHGVRQYWVVDVDARIVERWTPDQPRPDVCRVELRWQPDAATEPFVLNVPEFFERRVRLKPVAR